MTDSVLSPSSSVLSSQSSVLVTGGTGFAGTHLIAELLNRGFANIYTTTYSKGHELNSLLNDDHLIQVDLTDDQHVIQLLQQIKPHWIFHLASIASTQQDTASATKAFLNNVILQLNLLNAAVEACPEARVLVVGSAMEYGATTSQDHKIAENFPLRPTTPYAVSKATQDLLGFAYQQTFGLDVVRVRPFNHTGEGQTKEFAIPAFASQIAEIEAGKKQSLEVGNLSPIRDISDVKDIVRAYILLMEKGQSGEVYNLGTGIGVSMQEVVDKLCALSSTKIEIVQDQQRVRSGEVSVSVADTSKITELGWAPEIPLDKTLERVLNEWRGKQENF